MTGASENRGPEGSLVLETRVLLCTNPSSRTFSLESNPVHQLKTRGAGELKGTLRHARVSRRYPLNELVIFSCKSDVALRSTETGLTENVSTTGIAFLTDAAVQVGSCINLNLHLRSATKQGKTILLQAEGTVLRVEPAGRQNRIAAEIRFQDDLDEDFAVLNTIQ